MALNCGCPSRFILFCLKISLCRDDDAAALDRLNQEYNKYIKNSHIKDGFLKIKVNINGFEITIRGIVIDGVGHIGTVYQGDD